MTFLIRLCPVLNYSSLVNQQRILSNFALRLPDVELPPYFAWIIVIIVHLRDIMEVKKLKSCQQA